MKKCKERKKYCVCVYFHCVRVYTKLLIGELLERPLWHEDTSVRPTSWCETLTVRSERVEWVNVWFETEYNVNISSSVNDPFTAQWNEEEITSGTSVFFSSHCSVWAASWGFPFSKHTPTDWNKTAQTKHTPDSSFIHLGQWKESKMEMCAFVYRSYNTTVIWMKKLVYTHTAELWPG